MQLQLRYEKLAKLADILDDADNISCVYIIPDGTGKPRIVFQDYAFSMILDMDELSQSGVKKLTARPLRGTPSYLILFAQREKNGLEARGRVALPEVVDEQREGGTDYRI